MFLILTRRRWQRGKEDKEGKPLLLSYLSRAAARRTLVIRDTGLVQYIHCSVYTLSDEPS